MSGSVAKHGGGETPSTPTLDASAETNLGRRWSATSEDAHFARLTRQAAARVVEAAQDESQTGEVTAHASAMLTRSCVE